MKEFGSRRVPARRLLPLALALVLALNIAFTAAGCGGTIPPAPTTKQPTPERTETGQKRPPSIRQVRVAAAADLKFALADVIQKFGRQSNVKIAPTFGSS